MYINFKNNLFLPEGDDYSKPEFDKTAEEIDLEGNAILQKLRLQEMSEQKFIKPVQKITIKSNESKDKNKISFKDILNDVAAPK